MTDTHIRPIKTALVSLSDKSGLEELAKILEKAQVKILSTGNTAKKIREFGIEVTEVAEVTGVAEMLDGRVKTLHPKIHGGILANRQIPNHLEQLETQNIDAIDLVAVNLCPFEKVAALEETEEQTLIENIDIGGPTMIRSAAKNHADVTVMTDPADYKRLGEELSANGGTTLEFRRLLALEAKRGASTLRSARKSSSRADLRASAMRSSKSSPAGNSSMCTSSVASSWIRASAAFRPVLRSTNTYRPCEKVPNRVLGAGVPQIVHFGARTGFVQELQMSHRQTWLIRRDIVVGAALQSSCWGQARAFVGSRVCGGPSGLRCTAGLHRGCARGVGQRAPVCRCAATRRSKPGTRPLPGSRAGRNAWGRPSI